MKEKPILFSTPMVQAISEGRKTQTRRVVKPQPIIDENSGYVFDDKHRTAICIHNWEENYEKRFCPYGQIGDVLWVRETFCPVMPPMMPGDEIPDYCNYIYKASDELPIDYKWKPSIFMPREACRIRLEITNIRVERLQDISEQDAINEGIERKEFLNLHPTPSYIGFKIYGSKNSWDESPIVSYHSLWEKINGKDSWNLNPWVWVIEFKKL